MLLHLTRPARSCKLPALARRRAQLFHGQPALAYTLDMPGRPQPPASRAAAWLVHLYTASGAPIAFAGTLAVVAGEYRQAFLWMFAATFIDATDGWLARVARVAERTPGLNGARLDDIVDYLTFVFLPALLLYMAGLLPPGWGAAVVAAMLLSSAYGFSREDAKTEDFFFTGFPSYWNIVALYLYAAGTPPPVNAAILLSLSALVFVRIGWVYPARTPALRTVTITLGIVWAATILVLIWRLPEVSTALLAISLGFPVYYVLLSLFLQARRSAQS
jgi:phosphatidylcholine synthase